MMIFVIMTDGLENDSREYNRKNVFGMISKREAQGWAFTYIGANQDSWGVGEGIGIKGDYTANYDADNPEIALQSVAFSTLRMKRSMRTGNRLKHSFTEEEIKRMSRKPSKTS